MQNPTSTSNSLISDRLHTLIAEGAGQFEHGKDISHCQKCILANTRKRVVVAQNITPKKFFILSEFPELEDETGSSVFSPNSSSSVILNLVEKLEIQNECHYAFALKCVSQKQLPDDNMSTCVLENLRQELHLVLPQIIFCFGTRAFLALSRLNMSSKKIDVYLLPTAQELKQFPHWRLPVWSKLCHFKQKKNIDS